MRQDHVIGYRLKRPLDVALVLAATPLWLPVIVIVAAVVRVALGRGVLFRQTRPGLHERPFELLKFRTMRQVVGADGRLLPDSDRMTRVGRVLRSTSLDELPEVLNVLRGDMSLVGPRPLLTQYLSRYSPTHRRRHELRPGLTGLAQVSGRNALTWEQKLNLDVVYVDRCSFTLDLRILFLTLLAVLRRSGINAPGDVTMPEFTGYSTPSQEGRRESLR